MLLTVRRAVRLPIVPQPEVDELLSSWLRRTSAAYGAKAAALLKQLGTAETDPAAFDWAAASDDLQKVAVALGTTKSDVIQRSFAGIPRAGLMFVSTGAPAKTCKTCRSEFVRRGLETVVLHRWKNAVALDCARCGGALAAVRQTRSRALAELELSANWQQRSWTSSASSAWRCMIASRHRLSRACSEQFRRPFGGQHRLPTSGPGRHCQMARR